MKVNWTKSVNGVTPNTEVNLVLNKSSHRNEQRLNLFETEYNVSTSVRLLKKSLLTQCKGYKILGSEEKHEKKMCSELI